MKILKPILTVLALALSLSACASKTANDSAAGQSQNDNDMKSAHLQSSVFKLSKDLIDSIHEEGIVAYTS